MRAACVLTQVSHRSKTPYVISNKAKKGEGKDKQACPKFLLLEGIIAFLLSGTAKKKKKQQDLTFFFFCSLPLFLVSNLRDQINMRSAQRGWLPCVEINEFRQTPVSALRRGNLGETGHIGKWDNDLVLVNRH